MLIILGLVLVSSIFTAVRRPLIGIAAALSLWAILPWVAVPAVLGAEYSDTHFHPGTLIIAGQALVIILRVGPKSLYVDRPAGKIVGLIGICLVYMAVVTALSGRGSTLLIDQLVAPYLLLLLIMRAIRQDENSVQILVKFVLLLASVQVLVVVLVFMDIVNQPFASMYTNYYWFEYLADRQMGTLDHPLTLGTLLVVAVPLAFTLKSPMGQSVLTIWLLVGILLSQSRTALLLGAIAILWLVFSRPAGAWVKWLSLVVFGVLFYLLTASNVGQGIVSRVIDDSGSTGARLQAIDVFLDNASGFLVLGLGPLASYEFAQLSGMTTSFESAILMFSIDYGIIATLVLFAAMSILACMSLDPLVKIATIFVLVMSASYSSLSTESIAGPLAFTLLAIAAGHDRANRLKNTTMKLLPEQPPHAL
ncbi:hypothetical protein D6T63_06845 [Arthrobacter cheniae]|uniref:O-antigen ligase-related domain-containing protein n=1 Tax=Arthrobacter cheniae TaxID=1258888 RepID=A0A3A5MCM1_9MICC|nr:O-antigen ligase family protein [Arthrobacter cheniae]RJT80914.1 hypothetical protein D6T63_06845 [Arthrobacter cheniae]